MRTLNAVVVARFIEAAGDDAGQLRVPVEAEHGARVARVEQRGARRIVGALRWRGREESDTGRKEGARLASPEAADA
jgi:hypothetical protein